MPAHENKLETPSFLISIRFLVAILSFLGYVLQYVQKIDMSISIVCMINNTALSLLSGSNKSQNFFANTSVNDDGCLFKEATGQAAKDGTFTWPKDIQGFILSAYFYGYLITEIPGGWLSFKYGAKRVYFVSMVLGSVATILTPISARIHYSALIISRFIVGLAQGVMWPAQAQLWAYWAPPAERSRLIGFSNAGAQIGNVIALPLGSFLCVYGFDGGWASMFYIYGAAGLLWTTLWAIFTSDSPKSNKFIKPKEKYYILESTKEIVAAHSEGETATPWKAILTSKACIALFIAHACSNWGTYLYLTNIPTYMKEILKFDIKSSGWIAAIPYMAFWIFIVVSSIIGDKLIKMNFWSRNAIRKIFHVLSFFLPSAAVVGLSFVTCSMPYLGVALLSLGLGFTGTGYGAGFLVNFNDIAGPYAGIVFGISNTFATLPGVIAPYLVGLLTKGQKLEEWRIVFLITAGIYVIGAISIIFFGSAELQSWTKKKNKPYDTIQDSDENRELNDDN